MKSTLWMIVLGSVLANSVSAFGGALVAGKPEIDGTRVTIPIVLQGEQEGISAMDFRLNYDPSVLTPAGVIAGPSATAANKQVQSNVVQDDEMVVIVMGMNQNTFAPGEVARATFDLNSSQAGGTFNLNITKTTFASPLGEELDSSGSSNTIDTSKLDSTVNDNTEDDDSQGDDTNQNEDGADTTEPTNDNKDDMEDNTGGESDTNTNPAIPVVVDGKDSTDSGAEGTASGGVGAMAAAPDAQTVPPKTDTSKDLNRLAAATRTAKELRSGIPTPGTAAEGAPEPPEGQTATPGPGSNVPGAGNAASQETPGVQPAGIPAGAAQDLTVAKAEPSTSPDAPSQDPAASTKPQPTGTPAAAPKSSTKLIVLAVVAAVLVGAFLVRRKLFS